MMPNGADDAVDNQITDDELLYRRVPRNPEKSLYYDCPGESFRVLAQAFSVSPEKEGEFAAQYRLSVDRAKLRGFNPHLTRQADPRRPPETFGVVVMPVGEVRAIPGVASVIPDPIQDDPDLPDNLAHALICVEYDSVATKTANKNKFKEVIVELAAAANRRPWAINPPDETI